LSRRTKIGDQLYIVNGVFGWVLLTLSLTGYVVTVRRLKEKWAAWLVLAAGWAFFGAAQTLVVLVEDLNAAFIIALWIASWVLIFTAVVLMFLKIARLKQRADR